MGQSASAATEQLSAGVVPHLVLDASFFAGSASSAAASLNSSPDTDFDQLADTPSLTDSTQALEAPATPTGLRSRVVAAARSWIGTRYIWGGQSPEAGGFDCSGLVRFVFHQTTGLLLPRVAREQSQTGKAVGQDELKPGDLVFFKTRRDPASHVGIYLGNNEFLHAPSRGSEIRVDSMDSSYWAKRFTGARRLITAKTLALLPSSLHMSGTNPQ